MTQAISLDCKVGYSQRILRGLIQDHLASKFPFWIQYRILKDPTLTEAELQLFFNELGHAPQTAKQLKAGRNNQVFRVEDHSGRTIILKRYFRHPGDTRDRLGNEWKFLEFATKTSPQFVPAPLRKSDEEGIALFEFIPGQTYQKVQSPDIEAAFQFTAELNQLGHQQLANELPVAADACINSCAHLELLERRTQRLRHLPKDSLASEFSVNTLRPVLEKVLQIAREKLPPQFAEDQIASPSDFGFHNAIKRENGLPCFLDFEYAGLDGPGKLIADFFSQPQIRIEEKFIPDLLAKLSESLSSETKDFLQENLKVLLCLHSLKWCCILLNGFFDTDSARRTFSGDETSQINQLKNAKNYFTSLCEPRLQSI